jgi:hypothetical protein
VSGADDTAMEPAALSYRAITISRSSVHCGPNALPGLQPSGQLLSSAVAALLVKPHETAPGGSVGSPSSRGCGLWTLPWVRFALSPLLACSHGHACCHSRPGRQGTSTPVVPRPSLLLEPLALLRSPLVLIIPALLRLAVLPRRSWAGRLKETGLGATAARDPPIADRQEYPDG